MRVRHAGKVYDVRLPLLGGYQASNALLAAGLAHRRGEPADRVFAALETLKGVKGASRSSARRMAAWSSIDYAHKPEALAAALDALRPFAPASSCACSAAAATATRASARSWAESPPRRPTR
jgi:UDP-N-acetylmuramoyl-L-alanyl-D-glutamate--2,6-diaminopimelate ligase